MITSSGLPTPVLSKQQSFFSLRMNYETQVTKIEMAITQQDSKKLSDTLNDLKNKTQKLVGEFKPTPDEETQIKTMTGNL